MAEYYAISGCCFGMNKVRISAVKLIKRNMAMRRVLKGICVYFHAAISLGNIFFSGLINSIWRLTKIIAEFYHQTKQAIGFSLD